MKFQFLMTLFSTLCLTCIAQADVSGFLSDYSVLATDSRFADATRIYLAEGAEERLASYSKVMIDQPEIFIDPDSKYKGLKPDTMVDIAESLRAAVSEGVSEQYELVTEPGDGVLYLHWAITNMFLQKPKRGVLSFTPVGAVVHGAKGARSEFVDKNTLVEMTLEVEVLDSQSGDIVFAIILDRGQRKDKKKGLEKEAANWAELYGVATGLGRRLSCRLNNARLPEDERADCLRIPLSAGM